MGEGLAYYLPSKDLLVTLVSDGTSITELNVDVSAAYPDLRQGYLLRHREGPLAEHDLKVAVSESGLLGTVSAKATPKLGEVLDTYADLKKNIAGSQAVRLDSTDSTCPVDRSQVHRFEFLAAAGGALTERPCGGLEVVVTPLGKPEGGAIATATHPGGNGIYYRQARPYLVAASWTAPPRTAQVLGAASAAQAASAASAAPTPSPAPAASASLLTTRIVLSPSESPTRFLPIERTAFASNVATLTIVDGMPKQYDQKREGELAAALQLPAKVIRAYFGAVGALFEGFKKVDTAEMEALTAKLQLDLYKLKLTACMEAAEDKDKDKDKRDAKLATLGCGASK